MESDDKWAYPQWHILGALNICGLLKHEIYSSSY